MKYHTPCSALTLIQRSVVSARRIAGAMVSAILLSTSAHADMAQWFEDFKQQASDEQLYRFLYSMPKGGDLHMHMSGSARTEWFYDMALEQADNGYLYYTKVQINNCREYGSNEYGYQPYLMLFVNLQESNWQQLDACEQSEYKRLQDLNDEERLGWLNSMRLDSPHEGRDEFFQAHWQRMNNIYDNPYISANNLVRNMQAFSAEGLRYMEPQIGVRGYLRPDGSQFTPDEVANIYRQRLQQQDAKDTGVTVRFQLSLVRFTPNAEDSLRFLYEFAHNNPDFVAVNLVGREDNDKGHPLRFLETLRDLRRQFSGVNLSIHAGEVDEPNFHVRDTLLLGADRIGHGINLITDAETMRLMRHGPYMIEINLVSNLLLEYVDDYAQHPFPEYLRTGIPVALSTDDRGMWDSNISDEFFVAVKAFDLSWDELVTLSTNSLKYAFVEAPVKQQLLNNLQARLDNFETTSQRRTASDFDNTDAISYGFLCRHYQLCDWSH